MTGRIVPVVEDLRECFIESRDRNSRHLVTGIELPIPTKKGRSKDRDEFEYKRNVLLNSDANFVEIDLLRGGPRLPIEKLPSCEAYAMVSRYEERPRVGLWPVSLPTIPIPLKHDRRDATLDLQAILHQTYDNASHADYIYANELEPPLSERQAAWARNLIQAQASGNLRTLTTPQLGPVQNVWATPINARACSVFVRRALVADLGTNGWFRHLPDSAARDFLAKFG